MASDDPITIPPPEGEEDAYSAATRVGSIPSDLVAKFREQGLLPPSEPALPSAEATEDPATEHGEVAAAVHGEVAAAVHGEVAAAVHGEAATVAAEPDAAAVEAHAAAVSAAPSTRASAPDRSWMLTAPVALAGGATLVILGTLAFVVAFWALG